MQDATEEWRDIRGWEGLYQVSNLGRVRSVPREHIRLGKGGKPTTFRYGYRLLRPGKKDAGYLLVVLSDVTRGRQKVAGIHQLVCEEFHGPKPAWDYEVAHKYHDRQNNVASNLKWATHGENIADSAAAGRMGKKPVALNYSGVIGVHWNKHIRRWEAQFNSRRIGRFKDFEAAVRARLNAEQEHEQGTSDAEVTSAA